jgi:iron complex outermembrane receptor protein
MSLFAQGQVAPDLKRLSIEELLSMDVTSVSRRAEQLWDTAAPVEVITAEDIRRAGSTTLPEALRLFTGVQVVRIAPTAWAVSVRGFTSNAGNKLLVMIDGRRVYSPLFSGTFWNFHDLPLDNIDRIELVRGPGAALWGTNAVNGIISIITKRAEDTQGGLVRLAGGYGEDLGLAMVRWGGTAGTSGYYRVDGKYFYKDQFLLPGGAGAADSSQHGRSGFRYDVAPTMQDSLTIQGEAFRATNGFRGREDAVGSGGHVLGRWSKQLSSTQDFELQAYFERTARLVPMQSDEQRNTVDFDFQHRFASGLHDIVWGAGYQVSDDHTVPTAVLRFVPDDLTIQQYTAFVQDEIRIVPNELSVIVGSKFEHNDFSGFELQPSVRFAWRPSAERTVWASVSRAVRTPTRFDTDLLFTPPGFVFRGTDEFKSEELIAYETGYRMRPLAQLSVDIAAYYNRYDDVRSSSFAAPGFNAAFVRNDLNATTYGGEITGTLDLIEDLRFRMGYAHFRGRFEPDPGTIDLFGGSAEGNDPRHQFLVRSNWNLPADFEFDSMLRFVSRLPNPVVDRYATLDLRLGWLATPDLEISLSGRNLLDSMHPEFGAPGPGRGEVRRNFVANILWRF